MVTGVEVLENDGATYITAVGGETTLDFDFLIYFATHIRVARTRAGVVTQGVLNTDFTVPPGSLSQELGGTVNLTGTWTPAVAGDKYALLLDVPAERLTDFNNAGDFFADALNLDLDLGAQRDQMANRTFSKSFRINDAEDESAVNLVAPLVALRANKVYANDGSGNLIVSNLTLQQLEEQPTNAAASAAAALASQNAAAISQTQSANNATLSASAAGWQYSFNTATAAADPGTGKLSLNNAAAASATALYISETTGAAQAIAAEIAQWDDSTSTQRAKLRIFKQSDPTAFALFNITGTNTDNGAYDTINVAYVAGNGSLANNDLLTIQVIRNGDSGTNGTNGVVPITDGAGTVGAITANFTPDITLTDKQTCMVVSAGRNTINNPTLAVDGLTARTITRDGGGTLMIGDTGPAGYVCIYEYNLAGTRWELMNPARSKMIVVSPAQITANQNDYAPTGYAFADVLRVNSNAAYSISGLTAGQDGEEKTIANVGTFMLMLLNASASSAAANRFEFVCDICIAPKESIKLRYDGTSSRWRPVAVPDPIKFAVNLNGTGTIASRRVKNVSGIVDNGTGNYTATIDIDMYDVNYFAWADGYVPHYIVAMSTTALQGAYIDGGAGAPLDTTNVILMGGY